jgi:hypothetical protein
VSPGATLRSLSSRSRATRPHDVRGCLTFFPNPAGVIRLAGMVLAAQDDERRDGPRYFRPETMAAIDAVPIEEVSQPLLLAS